MKVEDLKEAFKPYVYPYVGSGYITGTEDKDVIESNAQICADIAINYSDQFKPKWVSVEESGVPESKTHCLFYSDDLRNPCDMVSGVYFPDGQKFMCAGTKWVNVTHWMPLPTKP